MRVRLNVQLSGTRDGVPWPAVGSVVELPDDEARDMLTSGTARPVDGDDFEPERSVSVPADVDEATERFVPETARHEPAIPVESLPEDDRRPDMSVIGLADDGEIGHGPANPPESLLPVGDENEPVDMAAEASGESSRPAPAPRRSKKPPTASKPLTTKTGPVKAPADGDKTDK